MHVNHERHEDSAWSLEAEIIKAPDLESMKALFPGKKDIKTLGNLRLEYLDDESATRVRRALAIITDEFLGYDTTLMSARVIKTLGDEASVLAEAMQTFKGAVDEEKALEVLGDKMAFLFEESAINKYVAGWSLQNRTMETDRQCIPMTRK